MNSARRANELDLHAIVDERLDPARARELGAWLKDEAPLDDRLTSWRRGADALRAVYDPILAEPPPLLLTLALRTNAPPRPAEASTPAPAPSLRRPPSPPARFPVLVVAISFFLGAASVVVGAAVFARFADPAQPSVATGVSRALTLLARALGFGL